MAVNVPATLLLSETGDPDVARTLRLIGAGSGKNAPN